MAKQSMNVIGYTKDGKEVKGRLKSGSVTQGKITYYVFDNNGIVHECRECFEI